MSSASEDGAMRLVGDVVVPGIGDTVWMNGAIDIDAGGVITASGPEADLAPSTAPRHNVGGLLMPGFVNVHAHSPMTIVRSVGDGAELNDWLRNHVWPREWQMTSDDAYWAMALGAGEMLAAGITTTLEMYLYEDRLIEAGTQAGMRVVACGGIFSGLIAEDSDGHPTVSDRLDALDALAASHADNPLATVGYGPHSLYDLPPAIAAEIAERALATNAPVTIHLEETQAERALVLDRYGKSATQILADSGLLGRNPICAHGVWLSESDRALLAEHGGSVAHCPSSNLKLGSGIAPIAAMHEEGIPITLGTDGPASNDRIDLWDEMRLAALLARGSNHDPTVAKPADAFAWATRAGGQALGRNDLGHLTPGAQADIVRVDLDQPAFTPGLPEDLLTHIVFSGSSRFVTDVWVGGNQVLTDGQVTGLDMAEVRRNVTDAAVRIVGGL